MKNHFQFIPNRNHRFEIGMQFIQNSFQADVNTNHRYILIKQIIENDSYCFNLYFQFFTKTNGVFYDLTFEVWLACKAESSKVEKVLKKVYFL